MHLSLDLHLSIQFTDISLEIGVFSLKTDNFGMPLVDDGPEILSIFNACVSIKFTPLEHFFALATFYLHVWAVMAQMLHQGLVGREFHPFAIWALQWNFRALLQMGEQCVPVIFTVRFVNNLLLFAIWIFYIWSLHILRACVPNFNSRVLKLTYDLLIPNLHKVVSATTFDLLIILARKAMNF